MRVLIVSSGSTGDVAPYTGLGVRLRDAGHDVTLATHAPFREAVSAVGLGFRAIPGDLRETLSRIGTRPPLHALAGLARPLIAALGAGVAEAVDACRPDAILLSTLVAPLGYQVAGAHGVRRAAVFLQPIHPTREFGSVLVGGRSFGAWPNLALGHLAARAVESLYAGPIRDLRRSLGLPQVPLRVLRPEQEWAASTFYGFSPAVLPRPRDWPSPLRVTGYWWPASRPEWRPPASLVAFLEAGPPPVFVGFGSMAPGRGERLAAPVLAAVRRAGVRAVLQAGWSGLAAGAGDDVLGIGEAPHEWLFPRMAAVVHHAGAGTTAAGLRAGVPAVAVPVLADQPFWARRLHRLGAAPPPIPRLTADSLTSALRAVTSDPHYAARAQALSARIRAEDGATPILDWLTSTTG